ncbi:hypothetical protein [Enterococcus innesii]|uniref:hypothetical protein n=1 Tax=Enterococcus innesii TaxID=2839759 RepID=UPI002091C6C9|nr:hypothetical protein [Enterococcus innesii]MCO5496167.1 hypothetical protein [Enterococcus innesii]
MKLHEIKMAYGLSQNNFYGWLRDEEMIVKADSGYIVGPKAFEWMKTLEQVRTGANGSIYISTQVDVEESKVAILLEMYEQSGVTDLYSRKKNKQAKQSEELLQVMAELKRANNRISVLENQVLILTKQLEIFISAT